MNLAAPTLLTLAGLATKPATLTLLLLRSSSKVSRVAGKKTSKVRPSRVVTT